MAAPLAARPSARLLSPQASRLAASQLRSPRNHWTALVAKRSRHQRAPMRDRASTASTSALCWASSFTTASARFGPRTVDCSHPYCLRRELFEQLRPRFWRATASSAIARCYSDDWYSHQVPKAYQDGYTLLMSAGGTTSISTLQRGFGLTARTSRSLGLIASAPIVVIAMGVPGECRPWLG